MTPLGLRQGSIDHLKNNVRKNYKQGQTITIDMVDRCVLDSDPMVIYFAKRKRNISRMGDLTERICWPRARVSFVEKYTCIWYNYSGWLHQKEKISVSLYR